MAALAEVSDLAKAWAGYSDDMESRAEALLSFVSAAIRSMCDADALDLEVAKGVACQVAARMLQSGGSPGVSQESWTASPFGGSVSYANPTGDIYLTAFEKRLLGIDDAAAFYINGTIGGADA